MEKTMETNINLELTILMPCLNEGRTVSFCVKQALAYMKQRHIIGEVLVVDNGSEDHSFEIAGKAGARVIRCSEKGYGNALRFGIHQAKGKYIIMGDCDGSYDFLSLDEFMKQLRDGKELVKITSGMIQSMNWEKK